MPTDSPSLKDRMNFPMFPLADLEQKKAVSSAFPRINQRPRSGDEMLHYDNGEELDVSVRDFWRWSSSDLLSNTARGVFAEFIVARAMEIPLEKGRTEWDPYDLLTPENIKIEVKSSAYIQSWHQEKPSVITFLVPKTRAWHPDTNKLDPEPRRQADVYVFALLMHEDQETIDPLNIDQWHFYVLPTAKLDQRERSQHSITLRTLKNLSGGEVTYEGLREKVQSAYAEHRKLTGS